MVLSILSIRQDLLLAVGVVGIRHRSALKLTTSFCNRLFVQMQETDIRRKKYFDL